MLYGDGGFVPAAQYNFATALNDFTTLSSTSTMPTGGSISRAGNAMLYDSTGKLTYAPNNLLLWSQDFRNSATAGSARPWSWGGSTTVTSNVSGVSAPDGTETASRVSGFSTIDGDIGLTQNISVSPVKLIGSIFVRGEGSDIGKKVLLRIKRIGGTAVATDAEITLTSGWQRLSAVFTMLADNTGASVILSGAAASNQASSCLVWGAQLEAVTYQTSPSGTYYLNYPTPNTTSAYYGPRFDYDPRPSLTGTASIAGSAVTLPAIFNDGTPASSIDSAYVGQTITVGGTGYPVTAYVGSTRIATVTGTPTSGSQSFTLTNPEYLLNRGLLVEGTRTNLLTYSNMASVGWLQSSAVITNPGNILAPDGTNNAALYSPTAGVNNVAYQNATMPSTSTASFYVKSNGAAYFAVRLYDGTNTYFTWFNITNGTIGTNQNASAAIVNVGNGWYRCSVTKTFNAAAGNVLIGVGDADNSLQVASASSKAYVWGAQLEAGFATSYIPTVASSVARAAETFSLTGYANRLVEAYYIDEQTGANYSSVTNDSATNALGFLSQFVGSIAPTSPVPTPPTGTLTVSSVSSGSLAPGQSVYGPSVLAGTVITSQLSGTTGGAGTYIVNISQTAPASGTTTLRTSLAFGWVTSLRAYTNAYAGSISTPSWLSFSGTTGLTAGNRTYYDSTGTLTYAPANLLTYSQDFTQTSAWTKDGQGVAAPTVTSPGITAPDGTNTAQQVVFAALSGINQRSNIWQNTVITGSYVGSVWLRTPSGTATVYLGLYANSYVTPVACNVTTTWTRFSIANINSTGTGNYFFIGPDAISGSGQPTTQPSATVYIWGAQLERVSYQTQPSAYIPTTSAAVYGPRYDYDPSTVPATPRGLLIEEQRVNILIQSQAFNTSWSNAGYLAFGSGGSIVDAAVAPDGTTTADKIVEDTSTGNHAPYRYGISLSALTYTLSVFVKAAERNWIQLTLYDGSTDTGAYFNVSAGTVGTTDAGITASIQGVGNGWYRCIITKTCAAGSGGPAFYLATGNGGKSYAGNGTSGILLWGAQLEHAGTAGTPTSAPFVTSYIPTTTASVTRAADVAQWTSAAQSSYFNAAAGTFGAQIIRNSSGGNNGVFEVPISAGFNDMIFGDTNTDYRYGSGSNVDTVTGTAFTSARVMVGYTASNFTKSLVVNNGTVFTGTAGGAPTYTGGNLKIGYSSTANAYLNGHLQSFAYYNQRLPNAILKQKSQVNAPY